MGKERKMERRIRDHKKVRDIVSLGVQVSKEKGKRLENKGEKEKEIKIQMGAIQSEERIEE